IHRLIFHQRSFFLHTSTATTLTIQLPLLYYILLLSKHLSFSRPHSLQFSKSHSLFMTPQQEIANFFQEFNRQKHSFSSDISSSVAKLSSPIRKAITMAIDENHI